MATKTLFLSWQHTKEQEGRDSSRTWFPVGRLDADIEKSTYRFRYIKGAKEACRVANFPPLPEFPYFDQSYESSELFPLFKNRIISPNRPDFADYLLALDLGKDAVPIEILSANGGRRVTDTFEVFPELTKDADGGFTCRFFLHGSRHVSEPAQERLNRLNPGEKLYLALELTNPLGELAVQIQTTDYLMLGWAPRYLVDDLTAAMEEAPGKYEAQVVKVNPQPAPSRQRVLVEMRSFWEDHEPMSGPDFQPLVPD